MNLKSGEAISLNISLFRSSKLAVLPASTVESKMRHSSLKSPMQDVTNWHVSISAEQRDVRKRVSSFVEVAMSSGISSGTADNSCKSY